MAAQDWDHEEFPGRSAFEPEVDAWYSLCLLYLLLHPFVLCCGRLNPTQASFFVRYQQLEGDDFTKGSVKCRLSIFNCHGCSHFIHGASGDVRKEERCLCVHGDEISYDSMEPLVSSHSHGGLRLDQDPCSVGYRDEQSSPHRPLGQACSVEPILCY